MSFYVQGGVLMYILANMWFTKLIKQFFFWIDKIVFNFIPSIYDLLISIARTSVLSQADILKMADRIYKLLTIFMIFKVTLSLITYVVNPDDISDKSKGLSKLGINIILSLALLILTPFIFNYAYQFQTIILEDNSLITLLFGEEKEEEESFFNTAGDDMAFITMSAFLTPNTSLEGLHECITLVDGKKFNETCKTALEEKYVKDPYFSQSTLNNYIAGVENNSLGLMFRQDLILATDEGNENFIMDYKFIFSTVIGVVIILLLITFCMDIAVRSIKLAFLQLIAPIPIISYVDPKSGKDGLFKKWYKMCFSTYISLFVRLLALYFAVYIISKVADMKLVDIIDGSYQTNCFVAVFIIIGALMFAKQLPKMLEGLGIKLDGGGKFTLNPLKKLEEGAIGGKQIAKGAKMATRPVKGLAMAGIVGGASLFTGKGFRGVGKAFGGAMKGEKFGKNFSSSYAAARARKKQVDQMKLDGVKPWDVRKENIKNTVFGGATAKDQYDTFKGDLDLVTSGYKNYYSTVLAADKMAKEFERRRVAAENAGDAAEAKLWQDSIDNRVKTITKSGNKVALNDSKNVAFDTAELMLREFQKSEGDYKKATYGDDNDIEKNSESKFDKSDIVVNTGLNNIQARIETGINELNSKFAGRFDYTGDLNTSDTLKTINGKAKGIAAAAENSEEKIRIESVYKYVDKKSNK